MPSHLVRYDIPGHAHFWTISTFKRLAFFWHDDLKVTIIDVGQGTSALLEIPGGDCLLIDGGGFSDNSIFDVGERIIAPLLWRKKIMTVDTLILSHPNSDHLNGLTYIARYFNVKNVWSNTEKVNFRPGVRIRFRDYIAIIGRIVDATRVTDY